MQLAIAESRVLHARVFTPSPRGRRRPFTLELPGATVDQHSADAKVRAVPFDAIELVAREFG